MRLLYIALAAALLGPPWITSLRADDACTTAADGTACPDDEDPCTVDACAGGVCQHTDVPDRTTCEPVVDAYQQTVELRGQLGDLVASLATVTLPDPVRVLVDDALAGTAGDLGRTADALAGRITIPPPAPGETLAQARGRAAFGIARAAPPRLRSVLQMLRVPVVRATGGPDIVDLARRSRFLYRGTNELKRVLRRLQRVYGVFSR